MAEMQFFREQTNDEKIAELAKDIGGVGESYIRALLAGEKPSRTQLRIATYSDCKRVFLELKDTRFATIVGSLFGLFVGVADTERQNEITTLLRQSDNVPVVPPTTSINKECQQLAATYEKDSDTSLTDMLDHNDGDAWTIKHVLTNAVKYSRLYERALLALIALRKIK